MGKSVSKDRSNRTESNKYHFEQQYLSIHPHLEEPPAEPGPSQQPYSAEMPHELNDTFFDPVKKDIHTNVENTWASGDPGLSIDTDELIALSAKRSHSSPLIVFLPPDNEKVVTESLSNIELDINENVVIKNRSKIPVRISKSPLKVGSNVLENAAGVVCSENEKVKEQNVDVEYVNVENTHHAMSSCPDPASPAPASLPPSNEYLHLPPQTPRKLVRTATFTTINSNLDCSTKDSTERQKHDNFSASPNSTATSSTKKKLVVRGLKNFVKSRGSHPPGWLRDFPCKSKFSPDNYLYEWDEGPNAPKRPIAAMQNCPKKSGRCIDCGIYADETCRCCKKCPIDCACPKPPEKVPDVMSQAFGPGWNQAQKVIMEMTGDERRSPVGCSAAKMHKGLRQFNQPGDSQPPHLKCHIDVLNPYKLPPDPIVDNDPLGYNPSYNSYPPGAGYQNGFYPMGPQPGFCYYPSPPPPMFPAYYPPMPMPGYMPMPMPMHVPPPPSYPPPQQQCYSNQNFSTMPY